MSYDKARIHFCEKMQALLHAGIDIRRALLLVQKEHLGSFSAAVRRTSEAVERGVQLHQAMLPDAKIYTQSLIDVIRAAELTGHLEAAFAAAARRFSQHLRTSRKLRQAATYPIIVLLTAIAAALAVSYVYGFGGLVLRAILILLLIPAVAVLVIYLIRSTETGAYLLGNTLIRLPLIGKNIRDEELSDFCGNMALFVECGIPLDKAVEYSARALRNEALKAQLYAAASYISRGNPLSEALAMQSLFPIDLIHMLQTGEAAGNIDGMLWKMSQYYDADLNHRLDILFTLLRQ